jgi:uncharacterized membrane protein YidH (DUF202 family)
MQSERTALAWQRTGLSLVVAATVLARLAYGDLGGWALLSLGVCLALCGWVLVDSRARYRGRAAPEAAPSAVGGWAAACAACVAVLALTELAAILVGR